jgi:hypothetical protein
MFADYKMDYEMRFPFFWEVSPLSVDGGSPTQPSGLETAATNQPWVRRHIPQERKQKLHRCEILKTSVDYEIFIN